MKITFDSENFWEGRGRTIVSIVLFIIAAFLIFHLGVMCGMHRSLRHHGYGGYGMMNGNQYYFNSNAQGYDPSIDTQYGEAAGYSGDGAMTNQQIQFQQGGGWQ